MKILLSILIPASIIFSSNSLKSQSNVYHPFPTTQASWCENGYGTTGSCPYSTSTTHILQGDTTINSVIYKKIYTTSVAHTMPGPTCNTYSVVWNNPIGYTGCLRNDAANKKVYYIAKDSISDCLLYNFDLLIGDTINIKMPCLTGNGGYYDSAKVVSIDTLLCGNSYRKAFKVKWPSTDFIINHDSAYVIEGIGSTRSLFRMQIGFFEADNHLSGFSNNHVSEYGTNCNFSIGLKKQEQAIQSLEIFPNPSQTGIFTLKTNETYKNIKIYNSIGQVIYFENNTSSEISKQLSLSELPKGIYCIEISFTNSTLSKKIIRE